ncbi:MAG: hypothetical protein AB7V01_22925, partial [Vicinamibacterales bacterium]
MIGPAVLPALGPALAGFLPLRLAPVQFLFRDAHGLGANLGESRPSRLLWLVLAMRFHVVRFLPRFFCGAARLARSTFRNVLPSERTIGQALARD